MKEIRDIFTMGMAEFSREAQDFIENHSHGGSGLIFSQDYGRLFALLNHRISREENILYTEYDQLQNQSLLIPKRSS